MTSLLDESIEKLTVLKTRARDHPSLKRTKSGQIRSEKAHIDILNSLSLLHSLRTLAASKDKKVEIKLEIKLEKLREAINQLENALHASFSIRGKFSTNDRGR